MKRDARRPARMVIGVFFVVPIAGPMTVTGSISYYYDVILILIHHDNASRTTAAPNSLSSWPGVSRPPNPPPPVDLRGGCATAGAWVAGTRPAMTVRQGPVSRDG